MPMTPEELALTLNDLGYEPLLQTIKALDADLFEVIKAIGMVRQHRHGNVIIEIADGKIVLVTHALKTKLR